MSKRTLNPGVTSARIKELRRMLGLSQQELANRLSKKSPVTRDAIAKWESGASVPYKHNLELLAEIGGCSVDWLIGEGHFNLSAELYHPFKELAKKSREERLAKMPEHERQIRESLRPLADEIYSHTDTGHVSEILENRERTLEGLEDHLAFMGATGRIAQNLHQQLVRNVVAYAVEEYDRLMERGASEKFQREYLHLPKENREVDWSADEVIILDDDILDEGTGTSSASSSDS